MAKKIDPKLIEILQKYGERAEDALWDCHGTWVAYHSAVERIAAKAGVRFQAPQIVEANTSSKTVAIVVTGTMEGKSEWSFGEASPSNNKNAYPYAMAEKRAKDRVTLKLIGLHGLVYSEEEADDFKPDQEPVKRASSASLKRSGVWDEFRTELAECSLASITRFAAEWSLKAEKDGWPIAWKEVAKEEINKRRDELRLAELHPVDAG